MTPPLRVEQLGCRIGGRPILQDVSFSIDQPCWFGLLGVNGSGKTTLLRCLTARRPIEHGRVWIEGADLTSDEAARALAIGLAPAPDALPADLRAGELLAILADLRRADPAQPAGVYDALGLEDLKAVFIGRMSSGMRQRVALFSAFLGSPRLVLLDEPFNWLDPVAAYDLKAALQDYVAQGATVLTALHDVAAFATRCTSGMILHGGRVLRMFDEAQMAAGRANVAGLEREIYSLFPRSRPAGA